MVDAAMQPRSPLKGHLPTGRQGRPDGAPGVTLAERGDLAAAAITLRAGAWEDLAARLRDGFGLDLPRKPRCSVAGRIELIWTGPAQWLALDAGCEGIARFGFAREFSDRLGACASVTDLTGARAVLRLAGPAVRDTLAKLMPIDLDDTVFPPGSAALTLAGHVGVTLWRPTAEAWDIACYRSFGESLAHALLEAAAEFGCDVTGS